MKNSHVLVAIGYCLARMGGFSLEGISGKISSVPCFSSAVMHEGSSLHPVFWKNRKRKKRTTKKR